MQKVQQRNDLKRVVNEGENQMKQAEKGVQYETKLTKRIKQQLGQIVLPAQFQPQLVQLQSQLQALAEPEEIQLPVWSYWRWSDDYDRVNNTFVKKNVDFMRKVCSQEPLPIRGKVKIRVCLNTLGTFSLGVITQKWTQQFPQDPLYPKYVSWNQPEAIFLTSFSNGGGVMNVDGQTQFIQKGPQLHLEEGKRMDVIIDMNKRMIMYINEKIIAKQALSEHFHNKPIFLFFQAKHINTSFDIEVISP